MSFRQILTVLILTSVSLVSQANHKEPADSLVRLVYAKSAQLYEQNGFSYRKVVGPARFLHNNTYLLCDTALWNVDMKFIEALGNVSIIQDGTVLESDRMIYKIDYDLAEFRGTLVELRDNDHNTLRTHYLDYNTKDSVAVFRQGGAMRDKDGQIIESINGSYDSKLRTFTFAGDVNMFTDSIFVRTTHLKYESDYSLATFGSYTDAWKDDNMLSANSGWYDRARELFLFKNNVHVMSNTQESWSDSLYFDRRNVDIKMYGNVQVLDTTRNVSALAGFVHYEDSLSRVTMRRKPAVVAQIKDGERIDTVWFGADKLSYWTKQMYQVDSMYLVDAKKRISDIDVDPVSAYRQKSRENAAKAAEEAAKSDPNSAVAARQRREQRAKMQAAKQKETPVENVAVAQTESSDLISSTDSLSLREDSLSVGLDSLSVRADSLSVEQNIDSLSLSQVSDSLDVVAKPEKTPLDTTKMGFLSAVGNVKVFRKDMQVACDSLVYSDVDSLARLFKEPSIWNKVSHQYSADSITVVVRDNRMEKASLMSEAFIHIEQDTLHYNQIKSTEMIAYFDQDGGLQRFDALGGAAALFYIEENDALATVNKKDAKMLSAVFRDGTIHRIYYFDTVKSDAYPVVQMTREERLLKGFRWQPEKRPVDRYAITPLRLRDSERKRYESRPKAQYKQTDIYFPGYIEDIYRQIEVRDSLEAIRAEERRIKEQEMKVAQQKMQDSLAKARELAVKDSLAMEAKLADSLAVADSLMAVKDSIARLDSLAVADSLAALKVLTKEEIKAAKKKEKALARERRIKAKEERWANLDAADLRKENAKKEKRLAKIRQKKLKAIRQAAEQAAKDEELLEKLKQKEAQRHEKAKLKSKDKKKKETQE